jgi:hypothetical protein
MVRVVVLGAALVLTACGPTLRTGAGFSSTRSVECAPFARQVSGIQLYGAAASWWDQASGRYERRSDPVEGGVLVFRRSSRLPDGHVSVVARLISNREIRVTQANWVHHKITRDEPVVDVSTDNDWSRVRVWWEPSNILGSTVYPTYGFISADRPRSRSDLIAGLAAP